MTAGQCIRLLDSKRSEILRVVRDHGAIRLDLIVTAKGPNDEGGVDLLLVLPFERNIWKHIQIIWGVRGVLGPEIPLVLCLEKRASEAKPSGERPPLRLIRGGKTVEVLSEGVIARHYCRQ